MDTKVAMDQHVRRRLEDTFGKVVATLIVVSATTSAGVPTMDLTVDQYRALCRAICSDDRVVGMLGEAGARSQLADWERLVS